MRSTHDLGGAPWDEKLDLEVNDVTPFARRVTALVEILRHPSKHVFVTDELRRAIESLPKDDYLTLTYYEKWIRAVRALVVEKGVLSGEEIDARVGEILRRRDANKTG